MLRVAQQLGVSSEAIRESLRSWLVVQKYQTLVYGLAPSMLQERLGAYNQGLMYQSVPDLAKQFIAAGYGQPRYSGPLMQRIIVDRASPIRIKAVIIDSSRFVADVPEPTETQLNELFDEYKDDLLGDSEPYGFGYKFPDRVKLEYMEIPAEALEAHVEVEEAEVFAEELRSEVRDFREAAAP